MDFHSTLLPEHSPMSSFPKKMLLPNEIFASQSCHALVSMLSIGDDDDDDDYSIFESPQKQSTTPRNRHCKSQSMTANRACDVARTILLGGAVDVPKKRKGNKRHTRRTIASPGDSERLLRENRNSSMPMLKPQRKKSMEDLVPLDSARNAVFQPRTPTTTKTIDTEDCEHSDSEETLRGSYNGGAQEEEEEHSSITDLDELSTFSTPSANSKWTSPVMTELLRKPMRKSSIGCAPLSPYRSAHSRSSATTSSRRN